MKVLKCICCQLLSVSCLILLFNSTAVAHDKVVVLPLNGSFKKIPNNSSPCGSSTAGIIRWTGADFEGCNGTDWTSLTPVPTVYSSGHAWMDRNLGASRVATSSTDTEAYGDLYQWGRYSDGHEKRSSGITAQNATSDSDVPGHSDFILVTNDPWDWRDPQKNTLWQPDSGLNNPCPAGFRLPINTEWQAERESWTTKDAAGAFGSPLKLVLAGKRESTYGTIIETTSQGIYWASTAGGGVSWTSYFTSSIADPDFATRRAWGMSVRCLKD